VAREAFAGVAESNAQARKLIGERVAAHRAQMMAAFAGRLAAHRLRRIRPER